MSTLAAEVRTRKRALKIEEVSELLSVSLKHVYRLVADGRIPVLRIGGCLRFDPGEIADWIEAKNCPA